MKVINFAETPSLVSQYMSELRDVNIQKDMLRFRGNLERIGEIMAYEISKTVAYRDTEVTTPLGIAECQVVAEKIVLGTIFRAGIPFHQGFLKFLTTPRMPLSRPTASIRRKKILISTSSTWPRRVSTARPSCLSTRCSPPAHRWT